LCYLAADLFDHVEDQDPPDLWWADLGPGVAINTATGLCFSASFLLDELRRDPETQPASAEIIADFYKNLLVMCSGQHLDLTHREPSLEQCWEIAAAKSGIFFALACRCGARLSTGDSSRVDAFGRFGYHLGILLQVFDDLEELSMLQEAQLPGNQVNIRRSLAVAYAFEVLPAEQRSRLQLELSDAAFAPEAARAAFSLIEQTGAGLYLRMEIQRHRELAQNALSEADPLQPVSQTLSTFLQRFSC
jgi:geranylgeranyl pyrophosphate synthase